MSPKKQNTQNTNSTPKNQNTKSPQSPKKSILRTLLSIVTVIAVVAAAVLLGAVLYFRLPVSAYYAHSTAGFAIPDIHRGFIPQGLALDTGSDCFFITGYMKDKSASPVYMVDRTTERCVKKLLMQDTDGSDFHGHAGGITVHGDHIYVTGGGKSCLYVFNYIDAIKATDGERIKCIGTFPMPDDMSVAYTASDEDVIYAGEFYREANYPTDESHKLTTAAGDYNQALIFAYHFSDDDDALFGIEREPFEVYSVTDLVQGMDTYNGQIYLSTSYSVDFSHIFVYDKPHSTKELDIAGMTLPLYELDRSVLVRDCKFPPMSEEIVCAGGRIYTMCESASDKYIFGKLTGAAKCYSTDIDAYIGDQK